MKKTLFILSIIFVIFSFSPSLYEIYRAKDIPKERAFILDHNYMFDYNFYLSRIRQGQEGRFLVMEKYYNKPHQGSFFQILYLLLGKIGGLFRLTPTFIYHASRLFMGFMLLVMIGKYAPSFFSKWWVLIAYLLVVTSGSWPIPVQLEGGGWRFATYMGWWSAVDSLQRITFIPHILLGQIFLLIFIWRFGNKSLKELKLLRLLGWGVTGFLVGIVFPPTLVIVYTVFATLSLLEILSELLEVKSPKLLKIKKWFLERGFPRLVFILFSFPSFIYLQLMFKIMPWKSLALFDIEHRMPLPYKEYALSLGPVLPLGIAGLIVVLVRREKRLFAAVSWVLSVGMLFFVFERIPQQSPLRFTEGAINIPLGILAAYLFWSMWQKSAIGQIGLIKLIRTLIVVVITATVVMGLGVMVSMVAWLTDQAAAKRLGSWVVPSGAQLIYPLKDFMDGVYFLRDNIKKEDVVLAYVTAGNFIPAYAGNFVYLGHANTPNEEGKEKIAARFFSGKMEREEAREFLEKEKISYVYFGPQERELGNIKDLAVIYQSLFLVYNNSQVIIYGIR